MPYNVYLEVLMLFFEFIFLALFFKNKAKKTKYGTSCK